MTIRVLSKDLKRAAKVTDIIKGRTTLPISEFVLLEANGKLSITTSDDESFLTVTIPAEGDATFKAYVHKDAFRNLIIGFDLSISCHDGKLIAEDVLGTHIIPIADVDYFPTPPLVRNQHWASPPIPWSPQLANILKVTDERAKTKSGISLGGITIEKGLSELHIWSTNGYTLGHIAIPVQPPDNTTGWCFIPYRAIKTFLSVLPKGTPISVTLCDEDDDEFFAVLRGGDAELIVRQGQESDMFNYFRLYPDKSEKIAQAIIYAKTLDSFLAALSKHTESVQLLGRENALFVFLEEGLANHAAISSSLSPQKPIKCTLSPRLLRNALAFLKSNEVEISFYGDLDPVLLKTQNADCLVMPFRD